MHDNLYGTTFRTTIGGIVALRSNIVKVIKSQLEMIYRHMFVIEPIKMLYFNAIIGVS